MHQSMVHVEIVLISKHQFYLQLPDGSFRERGKEEGEGNYSVERKGILKLQEKKKCISETNCSTGERNKKPRV